MYRSLDVGIVGMIWLLTTLPACAPLEPLPPARPLPRPSAAAVEYRHVVHFQGDRADIAPSEAAALERFIATIPNSQVLSTRILAPAYSRAADAANAELSTRRTASVAKMLRSISATPVGPEIMPVLEINPIAQGATEHPWSANRRIVVAISGTEVILPGCPDWSRNPGFDPANLPLSNLGCANAYNLGLMVADPNDLSPHRSLGPSDGIREAESIARYRSDKIKQLQVEVIQ